VNACRSEALRIQDEKRERVSALFFLGCPFRLFCLFPRFLHPNAKNPVALGYGVSWAVRA